MPHVPKSVRNSSILLATYYCAVSAAIIAFGSPLFRVLSFEYSALVALFGSLPAMWFAARYMQEYRSAPWPAIFGRIWLALLPAVLGPLVISLIFVRSCDLLYGLGYYAHIVLPATLTASLFGALCGIRARSERSRIAFVLGIWLATFVLSLVPGYLSQQIYTYGWQYGYFPGFVWDEYIELGLTYDYAVFLYMLFAAGAFFLVARWEMRKDFRYILIAIFFGVLLAKGLFEGHVFFGDLSHARLEATLPNVLRAGSVSVHHAGDFSAENETILRYEIRQYLSEIHDRYPTIDTSRPVDIYLYPTTQDLYRFVGTRRASIAKPWLGTLHIAEENLSSLKHELVHLLLRSYGSFPIYASWSTGLTEGAAVAVEDDYDGLRTADELACWAMQMQFAEGVTPLMKFTGFASTASSASYIMTGSFSKYLITKYGSEKYLSLYHTRDFKAIYGKDLEALGSEWKKATLAQSRMMSAADSVIARFYFEREAIVDQACLRRIGRLLHEAEAAYEANDYAEAFDRYCEIYSEDMSRTDALRGMILAKVRQQHFADADAILESAKTINKPSGMVLLSSLRGDIDFLSRGNKKAMKDFYDHAAMYAPNDQRFIAAVGLRMVLDDSLFDVEKFLFFRYGLDTLEKKIPQALYEHPWESPMPDSIRVGYALLRTLFNANRGEYSAAAHEWISLPVYVSPDSLSPRVRKAYDIIDRKVNRWMKALDLY